MEERDMRNALNIVLLTIISFAFLVMANAAGYPNRRITIVVPFAPGGSNDITGRLVSEALSRQLGQTIVVENRPGAGSVIGTEYVARAQPDGYTLLVGGLSAIALNPTIYKALPYDPRIDLVPLALIGNVPFVVVVNPALPIKTIPELIAYAKTNPGKLTLASAGVGSPHHLFGELFAKMAHFKVTHVPYRGSQPAVSDLMAGHVDMMVADIAVSKALIDSGKIRALAVTTKRRAPELPNIPTLDESGVKDYEAGAWLMLLAPARTPEPVVEILYGTTKKAFATGTFQNQISKLMLPAETPPLPELKEFMSNEIARWAKTVREAGLAGSQ